MPEKIYFGDKLLTDLFLCYGPEDEFFTRQRINETQEDLFFGLN